MSAAAINDDMIAFTADAENVPEGPGIKSTNNNQYKNCLCIICCKQKSVLYNIEQEK